MRLKISAVADVTQSICRIATLIATFWFKSILNNRKIAMSLDAKLASLCATIPECLAGGYVDIGSGMLLAVKTVDSHPQEVIALVAAATADLFAGPNISLIEKMFKKSRGLADDGHHYFQEIVVNSDNLIHVFLRGKKYPDYVAVFVCRKTANLGMALTKARMAMPELESAV